MNQENKEHKAGFVTIIGEPNVGKSTLINSLIQEPISITNRKPQTTRHRIFGILNEPDYQIVFSDTPGILTPNYLLQKKMLQFAYQSLEDADIILYMITMEQTSISSIIEKIKTPKILIINKIDLSQEEAIKQKIEEMSLAGFEKIIPISAKYDFNLETITHLLLSYLPQHPPFFPKDQLTDRPIRFFVSEIMREKLLLLYSKEIPYACQVSIDTFTEDENLVKIYAIIFTERKSQLAILLGKGGGKMKDFATLSRKEIERFLQKKVFLEIRVKVEKDWRKKKNILKQFGYI